MLPLPIIGLFVTDNVSLITPTLVTVPPPFPSVPVLLITRVPLPANVPPRLVIVTLSPATNVVTPVFVITYDDAVELLIDIPVPGTIEVIGLELSNSCVKLFCMVLNAVYKLSEFAESFGAPILIVCCPEIAIIVFLYLCIYLN